MIVLPKDVQLICGYLSHQKQIDILNSVREVVLAAPLFIPKMPKTGKAMSVQMSNCGDLGWVSDQSNGYRYQKYHPISGEPWPKIPNIIQNIWDDLIDFSKPPEACLINFYQKSTKMGLHQDKDEEDFAAPVLSISLGDSCLFRIGGNLRKEPTQSFKLHSGDVLILGGQSRLAYHGVDKIYFGTSALLKNGGRINLTLRRVS